MRYVSKGRRSVIVPRPSHTSTGLPLQHQALRYQVDLHERGVFRASVINEANERVIFELSNEDSDSGQLDLVEDGFMRNIEDVDGLHRYLVDVGLATQKSSLTFVG